MILLLSNNLSLVYTIYSLVNNMTVKIKYCTNPGWCRFSFKKSWESKTWTFWGNETRVSFCSLKQLNWSGNPNSQVHFLGKNLIWYNRNQKAIFFLCSASEGQSKIILRGKDKAWEKAGRRYSKYCKTLISGDYLPFKHMTKGLLYFLRLLKPKKRVWKLLWCSTTFSLAKPIALPLTPAGLMAMR